jgi:hypothetical protein
MTGYAIIQVTFTFATLITADWKINKKQSYLCNPYLLHHQNIRQNKGNLVLLTFYLRHDIMNK